MAIKKVTAFGQFGDILPGPQSHSFEPSGHEWLDDRTEASLLDSAFAAEKRQQLTKQLGESAWGGEGQGMDKAPMMEGDTFQRSTGKQKILSTQPRSEGKERAGLMFNIKDHDTATHGLPNADIVGQEPPSHLFRGMREDEWKQAQERGYIQSDGRGAIEPEWEGTNFATNIQTANSYMPRDVPGRIVKVRHDPADQYFTATTDDYARTRARVPIDRVEAVSEPYSHQQFGGLGLRDAVVAKQKKEGK